MKLPSLLLLLGLAAICVAKIRMRDYDYERTAELNRHGYDDYEDDADDHKDVLDREDIKYHISKKKEVLKDSRKEKADEEEKEPPKKEKQPIEICDGSDEEACHCEMDEVNCVNVIFFDETLMESLDIALSKTNTKLNEANFKPITARFVDNMITRLKRNRMPEGMEESLAALHLERNRIFKIDAHAFDGFKNISKLILEKNRLKTVTSDMFAGEIEKTLHYLNLGDNSITEMEKSPFRKLKNLKKLVLDKNDIVLEEDTFEGLENLETLSLDDCNLDKMPEGLFKHLKKLKFLSLRGNKFTDVPEILEEIPHLQYLDLSETRIAELHRQSFVGEPEMHTILFEYMPFLNSIQECAFCGLRNLKTLNFHNSSRLSVIDENAFGFKEYTDDRTDNLVELNLRSTNVSKLPQYMLEYDQMEKVELTNVPINCTCDMVFLKNIKYPSGFSSNARCAYPKEMKGKYLDQAQVRELCGSRYARGYRFFFALFGVISAAILCTVGYILFNKGYRFTNIRHLPMPSLPGANSAYTNLSRQEENELTDIAESPTMSHDNTPDFQPRPQMV